MAKTPEISVRTADHTVEDEAKRIVDEWWAEDVPAAPKKKRGKKETPPPPPAEDVSPEDTRTPEEIAEEDATTAKLVAVPLLIVGRVLTLRYGVSEYTEDEANELAGALVPVLNKYFPAVAQFGPEAMLAIVLLAQVGGRLQEPRTEGREVASVDAHANAVKAAL